MNAVLTAPAFGPALPEIVLAVGALVLVLVGAFRGERSTPLVTGLALLFLMIALATVVRMPSTSTATLGGSFMIDGFAKFMKVLALIGSGAALILADDRGRGRRPDRGDRRHLPLPGG